MLTALLRSRAFALAMHGGLWLLLAVTLVGLANRPPQFGEAEAPARPARSPVPIAGVTNLFAAALWPDHLGATNLENAFYTRHFIPPVVPPPPPPTTKQISATYHGFYQTGEAPPQAFLTVDGKTVTGPTGSPAAGHWLIAALSQQAVVLTNAAGQTNTIPFNKTQPLEVPAP